MLAPTTSLDAYNRVLLADPGTIDLELDRAAIVGDLPDAIRGGTFFGNGPSKLRVGDRLVHPFDGHGYVRAVRFGRDGRVRFSARPVRTRVHELEERAGGLVEMGLGTLPARDAWTNFRARLGRNVANTCVLPFGGSLLASWEGGHPHRIDPDTLETLGTEDFHGALHPREAFCAHTRTDPTTGNLIGLSPRVLGRAMSYTVREFDPAGREIWRRRARMDAFNVAHDFAITPRWVVIVENSVEVSLPGVLRTKLGLSPILDALSFAPRNARALLIPRGEGEPRIVDLGRPMLSVHHANAWEEGETVVLVTCGLASFTFGAEFGWRGQERPFDSSDDRTTRQEVLRFDIAGSSARSRTISSMAIDFPTVRADRVGRENRTLFGVLVREPGAPLPFSAIVKLDLGTGRAEVFRPGSGVVGEPLLAPRGPDEDDAFVLAIVYEPNGAELVVLDAAELGRGPVARVRLPVALPYGFHGFFQAAG